MPWSFNFSLPTQDENHDDELLDARAPSTNSVCSSCFGDREHVPLSKHQIQTKACAVGSSHTPEVVDGPLAVEDVPGGRLAAADSCRSHMQEVVGDLYRKSSFAGKD